MQWGQIRVNLRDGCFSPAAILCSTVNDFPQNLHLTVARCMIVATYRYLEKMSNRDLSRPDGGFFRWRQWVSFKMIYREDWTDKDAGIRQAATILPASCTDAPAPQRTPAYTTPRTDELIASSIGSRDRSRLPPSTIRLRCWDGSLATGTLQGPTPTWLTRPTRPSIRPGHWRLPQLEESRY